MTDLRLEAQASGSGPELTGAIGPRRSRPRRSGIGWLLLVGVLVAAVIVLHGDKGAPHNLGQTLLAPGHKAHVLGTDDLGRDVLLQVIAGLPWSIEVSTLAVAIAAALGVSVGTFAGWSRGYGARAALRLVDFYVAFPFIVFAVVLIGVVGRGTAQLAVVLGLGIWPIVARVAYSETLRIKEEEYVAYARMVWQRDRTVVVRHVLPALAKRVAVVCAFVFGDVLGASSALSLLGIGPPLGTPTWGNMLADGQQYLDTAPWIAGGAGLALVILTVIVNAMADRIP